MEEAVLPATGAVNLSVVPIYGVRRRLFVVGMEAGRERGGTSVLEDWPLPPPVPDFSEKSTRSCLDPIS